MALKVKVNGRKFMLRKVMTGTLMTSQRSSETQTKHGFVCANAQRASHENKGGRFSKYILISPDRER